MSKLCSVLLPSRGRPDGLKRAIESVLNTADGADFEILVRLDSDDTPTLEVMETVQAMSPLVGVTVGPPLGYKMLDPGYYTQVELSGSGKWSWCMNDDMEVSGKGWDTKLKDIPLTGYYVEPEWHKLGASVYHKDKRCGSYWIPRRCCEVVGLDHWPVGADYALMDMLEKKAGWQPWFMEGITIWHDGRPR